MRTASARVSRTLCSVTKNRSSSAAMRSSSRFSSSSRTCSFVGKWKKNVPCATPAAATIAPVSAAAIPSRLNSAIAAPSSRSRVWSPFDPRVCGLLAVIHNPFPPVSLIVSNLRRVYDSVHKTDSTQKSSSADGCRPLAFTRSPSARSRTNRLKSVSWRLWCRYSNKPRTPLPRATSRPSGSACGPVPRPRSCCWSPAWHSPASGRRCPRRCPPERSPRSTARTPHGSGSAWSRSTCAGS